MSKLEPLPCPFCGNTRSKYYYSGHKGLVNSDGRKWRLGELVEQIEVPYKMKVISRYIVCLTCLTTGPVVNQKMSEKPNEKFIELWNKRM